MEEPMARLDIIRFITVNFERLQGLKALPMGLLLFLVLLWANAQSGPARDLSLPIILIAAAAILYGAIDLYYRRNFGRVEPAGHIFWMDVVLGVGFSIVALGGFALDTRFRLPVSIFALVFAVVLFLDYLRMTRLARAPATVFPAGLLCVAEMALSAFLPLLGPAVGVLGFRSPLFLVYAVDGIIIAVYGIAAHLYLVRSMGAGGEVSRG
jgi:hypothetical protein